MKSAWLIMGLLLAFVLAACGKTTRTAEAQEPDNSLAGRTFLSTTVVHDGRHRPLVPGTRVRLEFKDDLLIADAGCATMRTSVRLEDGQLRLNEHPATGTGCDEVRHEQDGWLAGFLAGGPSWRLHGDELEITSGKTRMFLIDQVVVESGVPLEQSRWVVETFVDGQAVASIPAVVNSALLVFDDGTLHGTGGCNEFGARYRVSGATIRVDGLSSTHFTCDGDAMTLERAVFEVLDGEVAFEIDADRMRLVHPSGNGLELRGER